MATNGASQAEVEADGTWRCRELLNDNKPCRQRIGTLQGTLLTIVEHRELREVVGVYRRRCPRCRAILEIDTQDYVTLPPVERHERTVG